MELGNKEREARNVECASIAVRSSTLARIAGHGQARGNDRRSCESASAHAWGPSIVNGTSLSVILPSDIENPRYAFCSSAVACLGIPVRRSLARCARIRGCC